MPPCAKHWLTTIADPHDQDKRRRMMSSSLIGRPDLFFNQLPRPRYPLGMVE